MDTWSDTIRILSGYFWILGRILSGYYPDTIWILSGYFWILLDTWSDTIRILLDTWSDTIRILSGYFWILGRILSGYFWILLDTWSDTWSDSIKHLTPLLHSSFSGKHNPDQTWFITVSFVINPFNEGFIKSVTKGLVGKLNIMVVRNIVQRMRSYSNWKS